MAKVETSRPPARQLMISTLLGPGVLVFCRLLVTSNHLITSPSDTRPLLLGELRRVLREPQPPEYRILTSKRL
jgi:hypothetical protein